MHIIINTWKRPKLLQQTLDSVVANGSFHDITIIDDCTPDLQKPIGHYQFELTPEHLGVGLARRFALEHALTIDDEDLFLFCDNDLLFAPLVDSKILHLMHRAHRHPGCVISPYRPCTEEHIARDIDFGDYIFSTATAGAAILMDRQTIKRVLDRMPKEFWTDLWDWALSGFINGCIKPRVSLVQHVGNDEDAIHKEGK